MPHGNNFLYYVTASLYFCIIYSCLQDWLVIQTYPFYKTTRETSAERPYLALKFTKIIKLPNITTLLVVLCHLPIACCHHTSLDRNWGLTSFYSVPEQDLAPKSPTLEESCIFLSKEHSPVISLSIILWSMVVHSWNNNVIKKGEVFLKEAKPEAQKTWKPFQVKGLKAA